MKDKGEVYLMAYESWNERRKWIISELWWWCRASGLALLSAQGVHDAQGWGSEDMKHTHMYAHMC